MTAARLGPVALDLCFPCGGVWFDYQELAEVVRAGAPVLRKLAERIPAGTRKLVTRPHRDERCPVCRVPLVYTEYASMPGDAMLACALCEGFYVETVTLQRIADRLERQAPKPQQAAPPPVQQPAPVTAAAVPSAPVTSPWGAPIPAAAAAPAPQADITRAKPLGPSRSAAEPRKEPEKGTCEHCGERNAPNAAVCWACGGLLQGRVTGTCPRCHGSFREVESDGVNIQACDGCGGVWLERGRLGALLMQDVPTQDRLLSTIGKVRSGRIKAMQPGLVCQDCKLVMFAIPQGILSSQPVDTCPGCTSQFLEYGTLNQMLMARR
jgi:Zn-finger nucleic acid-binding protein